MRYDLLYSYESHRLLEMFEETCERSFLLHYLHVDTISHNTSFTHQLLVLVLKKTGESELLGNHDALSSGELHLCSSQGLDSKVLIFGEETNRE